MNHKEGIMENDKFHPLCLHKYNMRDWEDEGRNICPFYFEMKNWHSTCFENDQT